MSDIVEFVVLGVAMVFVVVYIGVVLIVDEVDEFMERLMR